MSDSTLSPPSTTKRRKPAAGVARAQSSKNASPKKRTRSASKNNPNYWRPEQFVQSKVLGICIHKGRLLVMEVLDDKGRLKGVRPLGGRIEIGETRDTALQREFLEELGCVVETSGSWQTFENIYSHHGTLGHEYCFGIAISLANQLLYEREILAFSEDSGSEQKARWIEVSELKSGAVTLYPDGLLEKL